MERKIISLLFLTATMLLMSCSLLTRNLHVDTSPSIHIGINKGGFVEYNPETAGPDSDIPVDAVTGATKTTFTIGGHKQFDVFGHAIETGLDYQMYDQSITYNDPAQNYAGQRDFQFHQLRLPVTYNLHLFRNKSWDSKFQIKLGYSFGATLSSHAGDTGRVPDYTFTNWDMGPHFGFSLYPYEFKSFRAGLYVVGYRGTRIYEDVYTTGDNMGANSYLKFGVAVHPFVK